MNDTSYELIVVEDEQIVALDLKHHIQKMGHSVQAVFAAAEPALDYLSQNPVNLVLMDIQLLGEMDGITASRLIRERFNIPVILLTAYADQQTLGRALVSEPFAYLVKPFESRELRSAISLAVYRHQMESAVREREHLLSNVMASIEEGIALIGESGTVYFANERANTFMGALTDHPFNWDSILSDDRSGTGEGHGPWRLVRPAERGEARHLDISRIELNDLWNGETAYVLICQDVTRAVNDTREIHRKTEELFRIQQMEQLHRTAGSMAHDFNNLVAIIQGNAQVALDLMSQPEDNADLIRESLDAVFETAKRAGAVVRKLLAFQKHNVAQPTRLDIVNAVNTLKPVLNHLFEHGSQLRLHLSDSPLEINADPTLVDQVILNLIVNARDAIDESGTVTLSVDLVSYTSTAQTRTGQIPPGEYGRIVVSDNGMGIEASVQDKIFEPYFSTKLDQGGSGIGLSTVATIVRKSHGYLDLVSAPGAGTSVAVYLPAVTDADDQS